jgi:acyl-CoA synthetase (AMP-forming)/AMP-acid ligase II
MERKLPSATQTLVDRFRDNVESEPDAIAVSWVPELNRDPNEHLSKQALWNASHEIACGLAQLDWPANQPRLAILTFPPGLDFIRSLLGCFMAGVVAVPMALPRSGRHAEVAQSIVVNCCAQLVLTSGSEALRLGELFAANTVLAPLRILTVDALRAMGGSPRLAAPGAEDLAFIQYTSGSTSRPKGVCVSHANLMANLALIQHCFRITNDQVMVSWLPHYHDMGLIGSLMVPLFCDIPAVGMAPAAFVKRPLRWLQTISNQDPHRTVISGGPNFAYQLCVDRVSAEDAAQLSLARWKTAFNGAEPIRAATVSAFVERFRPFGMSKSQILSCYGLAETTLLAAGGHDPETIAISRKGLEAGHLYAPSHPSDARQLVASGPAPKERIVIVDSGTRESLPDGFVGEIWVTGPSVPERYLNDPEQSRRTFEARIEETGGNIAGQRYLATQDIGAVMNGQLYVTGRSKELLIINGRNLYPHDVEALLLTADDRIEGVAVFAWSHEGAASETIVVVCELVRSARRLLSDERVQCFPQELERIASNLRVAAASTGVSIGHVRFVGPMGIGKTTSGKTAYGQLRREFDGLLAAVRAKTTSAELRTVRGLETSETS